jgi:uncharacterized RmlC-like cupin family protein
MQPVHLVRADALKPAAGTPAMLRKVAVEAEGLWAGTARTEAGTESGWHHHGDNHSVIYLRAGRMRVDFGPGGVESVEGTAGDFISVSPWAIHREVTPGEQADLVVSRAGRGEVLFNVDGPEPEAVTS